MANIPIFAVVTTVGLLLILSILTSESESKGQFTTGQGNPAYSGRLTIEFIESSGHSSQLTLHEVHAESKIVGSLDQDGRFDLSSTSGNGACSIFLPSNSHHVFTGTPKFRLTGDTKGVAFTTDLSISTSCSIPNPAGSGFAFHNFVFQGGNGGFFTSEGHASQNLCEVPNCSRNWYWTLILSPTLIH